MNESKRIINDYEIIQSFYVGEKEVVVGENKNVLHTKTENIQKA